MDPVAESTERGMPLDEVVAEEVRHPEPDGLIALREKDRLDHLGRIPQDLIDGDFAQDRPKRLICLLAREKPRAPGGGEGPALELLS